MLVGSIFLFGLVMALFALTMLRPGFGSSVPAGTWIVSGGLLMPVPILTLLVYFALFQGERLLPHQDETIQPLRIEARARQWEWEFRYLDDGGTPSTTDILHIPAGRPVDIVTVSEDVIHSFWVPRLGGKVDATPGHTSRMRLLADRAGRFGGVCAEYCGRGHSAMRFWVEAHEPEDFRDLMERGYAG